MINLQIMTTIMMMMMMRWWCSIFNEYKVKNGDATKRTRKARRWPLLCVLLLL